MNKKKKFDTGLIGQIADKGKRLNLENEKTNTTSTDTDISKEVNNNISTDVNTSSNISTNSSTKKKKYPKKQETEKIQRAYYFEYGLLKEFESFCKKNKVDKSEVISFALREFLDNYE